MLGEKYLEMIYKTLNRSIPDTSDGKKMEQALLHEL